MPEQDASASKPTENKSQTAETSRAKKEMLNTPAVEAKEMDQLLKKGLKAHNTVGFLTFVGLILLGAGFLFFRFDKIADEQAYSQILSLKVGNQSDMERRAYLFGKGEVESPKWPREMYSRLHRDIFLVAVLTLLLGVVFLNIEKAKMRRNDVLVYRALAREIEKLRLRVKKMEGEGKANAPSSAKSETK